MLLAVLLAVMSFSTITQARSHSPHSVVWQKIKTENNLLMPSSIAVSPSTHNYVAIASDCDGDGSAAYYFLDHKDLKAGWAKKGTIKNSCSPGRVLYGADRFIVTYVKYVNSFMFEPASYYTYRYVEECHFILTSLDDGSTWKKSNEYCGNFNPEQEVTFINIGSEANAANAIYFALKEPGEETRFVGIGSESFYPISYYDSFISIGSDQGPEGTETVDIAGDDENGWVAIASDGSSWLGLPATSTRRATRTANQ